MTTNVGVCYFKLICMLRDKKDDENKKKDNIEHDFSL